MKQYDQSWAADAAELEQYACEIHGMIQRAGERSLYCKMPD
jgi:hypothetical protein